MWKLFIDDNRIPIDDSWHVARSSSEAIDMVSALGMPGCISFDHDLGGEDTSIVFIKWLIERLISKDLTMPEFFWYTVHSMNPVGRENIECMMNNVMKNFMRA